MSNANPQHKIEDDRVLVLERVFRAPRSLVFSAYSDPEHLKHWWGPEGWELPVCTVDFRVGGIWHYCMKCVDEQQEKFFGMESWGKAIYREIVEPERIGYTDFFSDADGNTNDEMPSTNATITLVEEGTNTRLVMRAEYVDAASLQAVLDMGMLEGIRQTWDRLDVLLEGLGSM